MYQLKIDLPAIRAVLRNLKRTYPRKRGVIVRIGASVESGFGHREHCGYERWDGRKRSLADLEAKLVASPAEYRQPRLTLLLTHPAIPASERAARAAQADITRFVLKRVPLERTNHG